MERSQLKMVRSLNFNLTHIILFLEWKLNINFDMFILNDQEEFNKIATNWLRELKYYDERYDDEIFSDVIAHDRGISGCEFS